MSKLDEFRPNILGIICNWCCYGGADLCGVSRFQYPTYVRLIRVMCSGRVDLKHIFKAFYNGTDAVFVGGCWTGDCHYITEGNYDALSMAHLAKKLLEYIGINPNRLRIEWVSAGEGIRFANLMNDYSTKAEKMGPIGIAEGIEKEEYKKRVAKIIKLLPYIKLAKKDKLAVHIKNNDLAYENLFSLDEIKETIENQPYFFIDKDKCRACGLCAKVCPDNAIDGAKNLVHIIDQEKCIKCESCYKICPDKFSAVQKVRGELPNIKISYEDRILKKNIAV